MEFRTCDAMWIESLTAGATGQLDTIRKILVERLLYLSSESNQKI